MTKRNHKACSSKALLFPCEFPIKIVGEATPSFENKTLEIIHRHCTKEHVLNISKRHSKNGTYLALTITVYVENQAVLDSIYIELSATPDILMAL